MSAETPTIHTYPCGTRRIELGRSRPNGDYFRASVEIRQPVAPTPSNPHPPSPGYSATYSVYEARSNARGYTRFMQGRDIDGGGAIGPELARVFPRLAPLVAAHLCDLDGVPMHAVANGWYRYTGQGDRHTRETFGDAYADRHCGGDPHRQAAGALGLHPDDLPRGLDHDAFHRFCSVDLPEVWRWIAHDATAAFNELAATATPAE